VYEADYVTVPAAAEDAAEYVTAERLETMIEELTAKMKAAAASLEFEEAALLRDRIKVLEKRELEVLSVS
jgi:excinuclease ABC subunit B